MRVSKLALRAFEGLGLLLMGGMAIARALPTGTVVIGEVECFRIRRADGNKSIQERVDFIHDVGAKYLGGESVAFTIRPVGERQHIDVNGEFIVAVTPDDAKATGYKKASELAPIWRSALERAFLQSRARPTPPAVTGLR